MTCVKSLWLSLLGVGTPDSPSRGCQGEWMFLHGVVSPDSPSRGSKGVATPKGSSMEGGSRERATDKSPNSDVGFVNFSLCLHFRRWSKFWGKWLQLLPQNCDQEGHLPRNRFICTGTVFGSRGKVEALGFYFRIPNNVPVQNTDLIGF